VHPPLPPQSLIGSPLAPNFLIGMLLNSKPNCPSETLYLLLIFRALYPRSERGRGRTSGACTKTSASSARGSHPAWQQAHRRTARLAIVDWVLPAARRVHVHALEDGIGGLRRRGAGMGYSCAISCSRLRSTTTIFQCLQRGRRGRGGWHPGSKYTLRLCYCRRSAG